MIELYIPRLEDLWFRQELLSDPATMSYNRGYELDMPTYHNDTGCIDFPREDWDGWYARWVGGPDAGRSRFYAYLRDEESGDFLGEVCLYQADGPGIYEMGIVLHSKRRGNGLSKEGMALLLDYAFQELGAKEVTNRFERSREAALRLHEQAGFRVVKEENGVLLLSVKNASE